MRRTVIRPSNAIAFIINVARWYCARLLRRRSFPLVCGVFLTNRCNLRCRMCSIWADKNKTSLSYDQIVTLVDSLTPGLCYLSFSGGEPLMVDRLTDMVAYAAKRVPHIHLVSNGLLMTDVIAGELARAGLNELSISLDGERDWHNRVRGSDKSYDAAVAAIECVGRVAPAVSIVVNTVMFPGAVEQVYHVAELTRRLGVMLKVQPVNEHFCFEESTAVPDAVEFGAADPVRVERAVSFLCKSPHVVNSRTYLKMIPRYFAGTLRCPMIASGCKAPLFCIEANSYGNVSPCMIATGWRGSIAIGPGLSAQVRGADFQREKARLVSCRACDSSMYICYWEPMLSFPAGNFVRYGLMRKMP